MEDMHTEDMTKKDPSAFRYTPPKLMWKNEMDYVEYLSKMLGAIVRRLMDHREFDFLGALSLVYSGNDIYDRMADYEHYGWEPFYDEYYRMFVKSVGMEPIREEPAVPSEVDDVHMAYIEALETARRRLGYPSANSFWAKWKDVLSTIWVNGYSRKDSKWEFERAMEKNIPSC